MRVQNRNFTNFVTFEPLNYPTLKHRTDLLVQQSPQPLAISFKSRDMRILHIQTTNLAPPSGSIQLALVPAVMLNHKNQEAFYTDHQPYYIQNCSGRTLGPPARIQFDGVIEQIQQRGNDCLRRTLQFIEKKSARRCKMRPIRCWHSVRLYKLPRGQPQPRLKHDAVEYPLNCWTAKRGKILRGSKKVEDERDSNVRNC